jgi:Rrf2 family protein
MILSQTARYALRAVYYLACNSNDECQLTKNIAEKTKIPAAYLARIMSTLAKRGVLYSRTGFGGGFCLTKEALNYSLYDVAAQFDNLDDFHSCIFGFEVYCTDTYCPLHDDWLRLRNEIVSILKATTLATIRERGSKFNWAKFNV